ncbi:hypothetical protein JYT28_01340 [Desulfobulbus sp. AH-315-M07]|nr:hypothetical protein [Desulfobulbus sp. AH-315-M07]
MTAAVSLTGCASASGVTGPFCEPDRAGLRCHPTQVLQDARQVAVGNRHSCALLRDRSVHCWGDNRFGQCGVANEPRILSPRKVEGISQVTHIDLGPNYSCAVDRFGLVWCWGDSPHRQEDPNSQDDGELPQREKPTRVSYVSGSAIEVAAGDGYVCARDERGRVGCRPPFADSGVISSGYRTFLIGDLGEAKQIAVGSRFACALTSDDAVFCWGNNGQGQLGDGTRKTSWRPKRIDIEPASRVAASRGRACAIRRDDGAVLCWGAWKRDRLKRVGSGYSLSRVPDTTPGYVAFAGRVLSVDADPGCAVLDNGDVWCWDEDRHAEKLNGLSGVRQLARSKWHTCVLDAQNAVWCWGANDEGQVGDGRSFPKTHTIFPEQ